MPGSAHSDRSHAESLLRRGLQSAVGFRTIAAASWLDQSSRDRDQLRSSILSSTIPSSVGEDPSFLIYSITKTLIAIILLQMEEEGLLSIEQPIADWYPSIPSSDRITLTMLLHHTSGLPDYGSNRAYHHDAEQNPLHPWNVEKVGQETWGKEGLLFEPGGSWSYSNPGYMLLKRVAEKKSGESLKQLVARRIAEPLGLRQTNVVESINDLQNLIPTFTRMISPDRSLRDVRQWYHPGWVTHGVVASTTTELVLIFRGLFGGDLLSDISLGKMIRPVPLPPEKHEKDSNWNEPGYGLGLMVESRSRWGRLWSHGGGGPGNTAFVMHAPDHPGQPVTIATLVAEEKGVDSEDVAFALLKVMEER